MSITALILPLIGQPAQISGKTNITIPVGRLLLINDGNGNAQQKGSFQVRKDGIYAPPKNLQEQAMSFREFLSGMGMKKKLVYAVCADCKQGRTIKEVTA